jgi:hypothetical protein
VVDINVASLYASCSTTEDLLDLKYSLEAERDRAVADIDAVIAELQARRKAKVANIEGDIEAVTNLVKSQVLSGGATVKGTHYMAVYAKGRVSWDNKALDGYAVAHPEILILRKEGEPSVSFRAVK